MDFDGIVSLIGTEWVVRGRPDVLFRASRSVMNATPKDGTVVIPATDEAARDIMWFGQRFNLHVEHPIQLRTAAARFVRAEHSAQQVLKSDYVPRQIHFRKGKKPRHYQSIAADLFVSSRSLLLADELGLGKTISAAAAIVRKELQPSLVVAPVHLLTQWKDRLHEFIPGLRVHIVRQGPLYDDPVFRQCSRCRQWFELQVRGNTTVRYQECKRCREELTGNTRGPDVWLISYHKLHKWADRLGRICNSVVYDEAQELRRDKSAKWQAASRVSRSVNYRLGLSATPVHNMGGEMWNVMECLAPGRLGTKSVFRQTWCEGSHVEGKEPPLRDPEELGAYLRSQHVMLRRTRKDVGRELPPHSIVVHTIEADPESIQNMSGRAADLANIILKGSRVPGEQLNAYGQFETIMRQQTGIAKARYVAAFVEMLLEQGTPLMLFGWHRAVYEIWMDLLGKHNPVLYTGSESPSQKNAARDKFIGGETDLFICSLRSGAGLDGLQQRCRTTVFGELDWAHAIHRQCSGRVHRDGQTEPTMSYYLVCDYLTDPLIARALQLKKAQSDGILGTVDQSDSVSNVRKHMRDLAAEYSRKHSS